MRDSFECPFGLGQATSLLLLALSVGCSSSSSGDGGFGGDGGVGSGLDGPLGTFDGQSHPTREAGPLMSTNGPEAGYGADAFFAMDPPPKYCGVDGGMAPPTPGGKPMCPSDKNLQGCPCSTVGMTAACWPGLRVDRDLGVCKDGTTTCESLAEGTEQVWGPCTGYVLPTPGATSGAAACQCFSSGQWNLTNLSPCIIEYGGANGTYAFSSYVVGDGGIACPEQMGSPPPTPQPGVPWSTDTLKVDCAGSFKLCYTIKAGSSSSPKATDCVVGSSCVQGDYPTANVLQTFPSLGSWVGADPTCAAQFEATGGYGEMTVQGLSEFCEAIGADDGGAPEVFNRVPYCAPMCQMNPMATGCANCQTGGSGTFGN